MEKLVRDKIPEVIRQQNRRPAVRRAAPSELRTFLAAKLIEEANEFAASCALEELADVAEVVASLLRVHGWSDAQLASLRDRKRNERGGFDAGLILELP